MVVSVHVRSTDGPEEFMQQWRVVSSAFGEPVEDQTDEQLARNQRLLDPRYTIVAVDDGEIIGGSVGVTFDLVMPGGGRVPANGVAGVGVAPNRTGRGAKRAIMEETLRRAVDAGAAASLLMSSEAPLYGRYGYGCAFCAASYEIAVDRAGLDSAAAIAGSIDLLTDRVAARSIMTEAYDQIIGGLAGQTSRSEAWWECILTDDADWMGPAKPTIALHRNAHGEPDGYALYTIEGSPSDSWLANGTVMVRELVGVDIDAELALWTFLTSIPLARRVRWQVAPVEPRLQYRLVDPRQLKITAKQDMLWLRPLDVPRLLRARSYLSDGSVGLAIVDDFLPSNAGPWQLSVHEGEVDVSPGGAADVELTIDQLGTVLLGGTSVLMLADAGVVTGSQDGIIALDRLLRSTPAPFSVSKF